MGGALETGAAASAMAAVSDSREGAGGCCDGWLAKRESAAFPPLGNNADIIRGAQSSPFASFENCLECMI